MAAPQLFPSRLAAAAPAAGCQPMLIRKRRARVPIEVLADTIHAFPSTSRILNGLFAEAAQDLAPS